MLAMLTLTLALALIILAYAILLLPVIVLIIIPLIHLPFLLGVRVFILRILFWIILPPLILVFFVYILLLQPIIIILLSIPIRYNLNANIDTTNDNDKTIIEKIVAKVQVTYWLKLIKVSLDFNKGLLSTVLSVARFDMNIKSSKKAKKKESKKKDKVKKPDGSSPTSLTDLYKSYQHKVDGDEDASVFDVIEAVREDLTSLQVVTIIKLVLHTFRKIGNSLLPKHIDICGQLALSDPGTTGMYLSLYEAMAGMFNIRNVIRINGDYEAEEITVRGSAEICGKIVIRRILGHMIRLIFKRPIRVHVWRGTKFGFRQAIQSINNLPKTLIAKFTNKKAKKEKNRKNN